MIVKSVQYYLDKCLGLRHYLDLWLIEQNRINTTFKIFQQTGLLHRNNNTQFPEFDIWWDMNKDKYTKE